MTANHLLLLSVLLLSPVFLPACGSENRPMPDGNAAVDGGSGAVDSGAGPRDVGQEYAQMRICPNLEEQGVRFSGTPCPEDAAQSACGTACVPVGVPSGHSKAGDSFFERCGEEAVLCVGKGREVEKLAEAAELVRRSDRINKILIASGKYEGGVTFKGIDRELVIEGQSNNPQEGAVIEAPSPSGSPSAEYAALTFRDVRKVTVRRLVLTGAGHGLRTINVVAVTIDNDYFPSNTGTGAWLSSSKAVRVKNSVFKANGSSKKDKTTSGNLYGLMIDRSQDVSVASSTFEGNGAGGLLVSKDEISVTIDNDYRVTNDDIAVTIDNDYKVSVDSCMFTSNGPVGRAAYPLADGSCGRCPVGTFCEAGRCHPLLVKPKDPRKPKGAASVLGVGAHVSGYGEVVVRGNSFFRNDTSALMVHSVGKLSVLGNAIERNGSRPAANKAGLRRFGWPSVDLRNIRREVGIRSNMLADNIRTAIQLTHRRSSSAELKQLAMDFKQNHISGTGKFMEWGRMPYGNGLLVITEKEKTGVTLAMSGNFFKGNGRTAMCTSGAVQGEIRDNRFQEHPFRAIVLHDTGESKKNTLRLAHNEIRGAGAFAIQVFGGAARLLIESNLLEKVGRAPTATADDAEADAINLTRLKGEKALVANNIIKTAGRAAIFLDSARAELENNEIEGVKYEVVSQNGADANTGAGAPGREHHRPSKPMPNRKDIGE